MLEHWPLLAARLLTLTYLLVLTGTSAVDKVFDRAGNLGYLQGFFAKTFLKNVVGLLLTLVTLEFWAAALALAAGLVQLLATQERTFACLGAALTGVTMLSLFTGQQLAKDYTGGTTIVPHLAVALAALLLCA